MDLSMPIMDGFMATESIRRTHHERKAPQPMIVATTGHAEDYYIKKAWRYEFDELLTKPIDHDDLSEILSELLICP